MNKKLCILSILLVCLLSAGCERPNLYSYRKDREIAIDGKYTDWGNYISYYSEKEKLVVNLANDDEYLYICLISRSRRVETQIMESGLQLWFDPEAGQRKIFGIRFPIGMRVMGMPIAQRMKKEDRPLGYDDSQDPLRREDWGDREFDKKLEELENLQDKMEVILPLPAQGAKEDRDRRAPPDDKKPPEEKGVAHRRGFPPGGKELLLEEAHKYGLEAKLGRENGYFVYELKVPLNRSEERPYAIGSKPGNPIGLGIEVQNASTGRFAGSASRSPEDNNREPPELASGAKFGTGSSYSDENIKLWIIINLAGS
ncbi:MAG: hypothetical protein WC561_05580 [Candidatus Omnitrophota bacterium]|jgi:hypothetical protein